MSPTKPLAAMLALLMTVGAACSTDAATAETVTATADDTTAAVVTETDTDAATDTESATAESAGVDTTVAETGPPQGGPGGAVDPASVTTVDELVSLINEAYGDAGLGLHRGHQPVESTLIEVLGITHDEMHVRMEEQGQNLAAVATDLGIDPQTLIDALVDSWSPGIDNLVASGTITDAEAESYLSALNESFTYRVTWNGTDATPTFTGI